MSNISEGYQFIPYEGIEPFIFISYSRDDSETVFKIIKDLNSRNYRIWYDKGVHVGDDFIRTLSEKINKCEIFMVFLSETYINSNYCKKEIDYAFHCNKTMIPIMLENFDLPEEYQFRIGTINWKSLAEYGAPNRLVDDLCVYDKNVMLPCIINNSNAVISKRDTPRCSNCQHISEYKNNVHLLIPTLGIIASLAIVTLFYVKLKTNSSDHEDTITSAPLTTGSVFSTSEETMFSPNLVPASVSPVSQKAGIIAICGENPSSLDLDSIQATIDYPKNSDYLSSYETKYIKSGTAFALHGLKDGANWQSKAIEMSEGEEVLVIAKHSFSANGTNYTYCCCIFKRNDEYYSGWINNQALSNQKT